MDKPPVLSQITENMIAKCLIYLADIGFGLIWSKNKKRKRLSCKIGEFIKTIYEHTELVSCILLVLNDKFLIWSRDNTVKLFIC